MVKVSKNIKKLRQDRGFTQDGLAEKINVSRQAISSWENGRTQPDLEMLEALSEAFGVPMEELIYGEKRKTTLAEAEAKENRVSTAVIIVSILGSLLVAVGLILIFATGWEKLPLTAKATFSALPLLGSQAFAMFVMLKKKESVSFRESAALLWSVGVITTVAMLSSVYTLNFGYVNWLIIDSILIFPAMLFFGAVSPLAIFYYMVIHWFTEKADLFYFPEISFSMIFYFVITLALLIFTTAFFGKKKESLTKISKEYIRWLSIVAFGTFVCFCNIGLQIPFVSLFAVASCLFVLCKKDEAVYSPFYLLGNLVTALGAVVLWSFRDMRVVESKQSTVFITFCVIYFIAYALSIFKSRESFKNNIYKILQTVTLALIFAANIVWHLVFWHFYKPFAQSDSPYEIYELNLNFKPLFFVFQFLLLAMGILYLLQGIKENKLFPINLGFIYICIVAVYFVWGIELSTLTQGIVLIVLGLGLLALNLELTKKVKSNAKLQKAEEEGEVQ